jgi:hypothetical protein
MKGIREIILALWGSAVVWPATAVTRYRDSVVEIHNNDHAAPKHVHKTLHKPGHASFAGTHPTFYPTGTGNSFPGDVAVGTLICSFNS